jgi:hypothetical protein
MVNAISFCLYGPPNPFYYQGLTENLDLMAKEFPGWVAYVYTGSDVPEIYLSKILAYPFVRVRKTGITGAVNTVHRFFAIDEPDVELMMVRDVDSRIHWKDRWAIKEFIKSSFTFHMIRDHHAHTAYMAAGMWGMRKCELKLRELFYAWTPRHSGSGDPDDIMGFGIDQNFLKLCVYDQTHGRILVHCSHKFAFPWETAAEFPFQWTERQFCGRKEEVGPTLHRITIRGL